MDQKMHKTRSKATAQSNNNNHLRRSKRVNKSRISTVTKIGRSTKRNKNSCEKTETLSSFTRSRRQLTPKLKTLLSRRTRKVKEAWKVDDEAQQGVSNEISTMLRLQSNTREENVKRMNNHELSISQDSLNSSILAPISSSLQQKSSRKNIQGERPLRNRSESEVSVGSTRKAEDAGWTQDELSYSDWKPSARSSSSSNNPFLYITPPPRSPRGRKKRRTSSNTSDEYIDDIAETQRKEVKPIKRIQCPCCYRLIGAVGGNFKLHMQKCDKEMFKGKDYVTTQEVYKMCEAKYKVDLFNDLPFYPKGVSSEAFKTRRRKRGRGRGRGRSGRGRRGRGRRGRKYDRFIDQRAVEFNHADMGVRNVTNQELEGGRQKYRNNSTINPFSPQSSSSWSHTDESSLASPRSNSSWFRERRSSFVEGFNVAIRGRALYDVGVPKSPHSFRNIYADGRNLYPGVAAVRTPWFDYAKGKFVMDSLLYEHEQSDVFHRGSMRTDVKLTRRLSHQTGNHFHSSASSPRMAFGSVYQNDYYSQPFARPQPVSPIGTTSPSHRFGYGSPDGKSENVDDDAKQFMLSAQPLEEISLIDADIYGMYRNRVGNSNEKGNSGGNFENGDSTLNDSAKARASSGSSHLANISLPRLSTSSSSSGGSSSYYRFSISSPVSKRRASLRTNRNEFMNEEDYDHIDQKTFSEESEIESSHSASLKTLKSIVEQITEDVDLQKP
eukprot:g5568.t1